MWAGGHGASDELGPGFAVVSEGGVKAIAKAEGIDERQRNHGRGDVAFHAVENDPDLLGLVGKIVFGCKGVDGIVGDLPAPAQDCRVAVIRAPPRAVTPRKVQCREAPAPALSSRPSPRERTDAPRATVLPSGANCGQGGSAD